MEIKIAPKRGRKKDFFIEKPYRFWKKKQKDFWTTKNPQLLGGFEKGNVPKTSLVVKELDQ